MKALVDYRQNEFASEKCWQASTCHRITLCYIKLHVLDVSHRNTDIKKYYNL